MKEITFDDTNPPTWMEYNLRPRMFGLLNGDRLYTADLMEEFIDLMLEIRKDSKEYNMADKQFMADFIDAYIERRYGKDHYFNKYSNGVDFLEGEDGFRLKNMYQAMVSNPMLSTAAYAFTQWYAGGGNNCVLGKRSQNMFANTDLGTSKFSDCVIPGGRSVYFSLPGYTGELYDIETGYHSLLGVLYFIEPEANNLSLAFWGLAKDSIKLKDGHPWEYNSDTFLVTKITQFDLETYDLDELVERLVVQDYFRVGENKNEIGLTEKAQQGIRGALLITLNALIYWGAFEDKVDLEHPLDTAFEKRMSTFRQRAARSGKKKRRSFEAAIAKETKEHRKRGQFYYMEPFTSEIQHSDDGINSRKKGRSPVTHIRKGHWRHYRVNEKREKAYKRYIKPILVNGKTSTKTKTWKTKLDEEKKNESK